MLPATAWAQAVPIGGDFAISQATTQCAIRADVAMAPDGRFVVAWSTTSSDRIMTRRFDADGVALEGEQTLTSTQADDPSVGMDADGDFVLAWQSEIGGEAQPLVQRFDSSGTQVGTVISPGSSGFENTDMEVAVADGGEFVLAWRSVDAPNGAGVGARRFASDGTVIGFEIEVSPTATTGNESPDIAVDPDGDAFVVTWTASGEGSDISARRFASDGTPAGAAFVVNSYTTGDQRESRVSMAADGTFAIAWHGEADGDFSAATLARFAADATPTGEVQLGTESVSQNSASSALSNDGGSLLAAWTETFFINGDSVYENHALANEASDFPVPNNFRNRFAPDIALDDRERGVVVWLDDLDGDVCNSVRGARYQLYRELDGDPFHGTVHSLQTSGAWKHFVYFPQGPSRLEITLDGLSGDADLYTRFGDFASVSDFNCRPFSGGTTAETCVVDTPGPPLLVGVNGFHTVAVDFTLQVTEVPALFLDGFETGDTSAWSSTVP